MKKLNNSGFSLVETLVVTIFIATVLIFLFIQFSNLNSSYEDSFKYNTVEGIYALEDIRDYLEIDSQYEIIENKLSSKDYIDISDCSVFTDLTYCQKLFEYENIARIIVVNNIANYEGLFETAVGYKIKLEDEFLDFINQINNQGSEKYRLIVKFNNDTYATIRFGEKK